MTNFIIERTEFSTECRELWFISYRGTLAGELWVKDILVGSIIWDEQPHLVSDGFTVFPQSPFWGCILA